MILLRAAKVAVMALVAVIALYALLLASAGVLFSPGCEARPVAEIPSPEGRYVATVTILGCGATTREVTIVRLRAPGALRLPWEEERVFSYEGRPSGVVVDWTGENTLVIQHACLGIHIQQRAWRNVEIVYLRRDLPGANCYPPR